MQEDRRTESRFADHDKRLTKLEVSHEYHNDRLTQLATVVEQHMSEVKQYQTKMNELATKREEKSNINHALLLEKLSGLSQEITKFKFTLIGGGIVISVLYGVVLQWDKLKVLFN